MEGTYVILMPPWRAGDTSIQRVLTRARVEIWLLGEIGWRYGFIMANVTDLAHRSAFALGGGWGIVVAEVRVSVAADGSFGAVGVEARWGGAKCTSVRWGGAKSISLWRKPSRTESARKAPPDDVPEL
ncbi:uncharacterized protein STEHIDRAFT_116873, partial [Stereum hirsutum FP-91666 SS1]